MKKQRLPRKTKKQLKRTIITLDLSLVPTNWTVDKWLYYAREMGILVWDSDKHPENKKITNPFGLISLGNKKNLYKWFKIKNVMDINNPYNGNS